MFKKIVLGALFLGMTAVLIFGAIIRTSAKSAEGDLSYGGGRGYGRTGESKGRILPANPDSTLDETYSFDQIDAASLDQDEISGLLFMREEEKLARDVYQALYDTWGQAIFQRIASSEETHMQSVARIIAAYGLDDPAKGLEPGQFVNNDLQALYNELVERGKVSLENAYQVGVDIENLDINDLRARIAGTDDPAIRRLYENLLTGSENHLRAFSGGQGRSSSNSAGGQGRGRR